MHINIISKFDSGRKAELQIDLSTCDSGHIRAALKGIKQIKSDRDIAERYGVLFITLHFGDDGRNDTARRDAIDVIIKQIEAKHDSLRNAARQKARKSTARSHALVKQAVTRIG